MDNESRPNKLGIPSEALCSVAGGISGTKSKLADDILQSVANLPMTDGVLEYQVRAEALDQWRHALQKGVLPDLKRVPFPAEPFRTKFAEALSSLEMPRFTRRYPKLADAMMREMLKLTSDFETKLLELQAQDQQAQDQQQPQNQQMQSAGEGQSNPEDSPKNSDMQGDSGNADADNDAESDSKQDPGKKPDGGESGEGGEELQVSLEQQEGEGGPGEGAGEEGDEESDLDIMEKMAEELADALVEEFEEKMAPVMDNVEAATGVMGDLDDLLEGQKGWDLSSSLWERKGWKELKDLRTKLENLRELRDLVRSLGRGGGKGPVRMAPEHIFSPNHPFGVIRSPRVPEEVRSLHRSDNLSQILPSEVALLTQGRSSVDSTSLDDSDRDIDDDEVKVTHPARLLFKARLAEKGLVCYERSGWLDDEPARATGRREMRPAAELGPIIVCLDTSGSMRGSRETVAKALVLACMRGAHSQQRRCFVYAFSGPRQVQAFELGMNASSLEQLLDFMQFSFNGGTDVDAPFELALQRLENEEWEAADILMVSDGEIPPPSKHLLEKLEDFSDDLGLEVHGLLVGSDVTPAMEKLCTHVHLFKSWTAVGGRV